MAVQDVRRVTIWGNHSSTQYPDIAHATAKGQPVNLDEAWVQAEFVPTVQKRGAAVIAARKLSSAMSAAKVKNKKNRIVHVSKDTHARMQWYGSA